MYPIYKSFPFRSGLYVLEIFTKLSIGYYRELEISIRFVAIALQRHYLRRLNIIVALLRHKTF